MLLMWVYIVLYTYNWGMLKVCVLCTCLCYVHNNASKLCIHHLILFRSHHSFKWTETALFNCNKLGPTWNSKLMKVSRYTLISNQESHKYQYMYIIGWLVSSTRKCIIRKSLSLPKLMFGQWPYFQCLRGAFSCSYLTLWSIFFEKVHFLDSINLG